MYLWVDTETGGTNPLVNPLLQIAAVMTTEDFVDLGYWMSYCKPNPALVLEPKALEINGLSEEFLSTQPDEVRVMLGFHWWVNSFKETYDLDPVLAGFRTDFDKDFLVAASERTNVEFEFNRHVEPLDIYKVAQEKLHLHRYRLIDVREHFDMNTKRAHSAMFDIMDTLKIGRRLLK